MKKIISDETVKGLAFVLAMWLFSRLVIVISMGLIAPLIPLAVIQLDPFAVPGFTPQFGWNLFALWDGGAYVEIATLGYARPNDPEPHVILWFPLFPLLMRLLMVFGISPAAAGTIINNLAFLGALGILYIWAKELHGRKTARWATAILAWSPFSLFGTLVYTEGLYLLLTVAALRAFEKGQHSWAALWGAMASATRVPGLTLVPAFLLVAWKERRPRVAYAAALAVAGGVLLFSAYCAIQFGDPLAFIHGQQSIEEYPSLGKDIRRLINIAMLAGCGYLFWHFRQKLSRVALAYSFCSLLLLSTIRAVRSVNRYIYGIVTLSLALGLLFTRYPRWGYVTLSLCALFLVIFSIRFSWNLWVA